MESGRVRRGRGVGRFLLLLGPGRRIVITGVHALGNGFWIGALQADRGRALQDEVCDPHIYRDVGVEIFAEAKDTLYSFSLESLERLFGAMENLRRAAGDGQDSACCDEPTWERFNRCKSPRGCVVRG